MLSGTNPMCPSENATGQQTEPDCGEDHTARFWHSIDSQREIAGGLCNADHGVIAAKDGCIRGHVQVIRGTYCGADVEKRMVQWRHRRRQSSI
jgi:hypothetical protein